MLKPQHKHDGVDCKDAGEGKSSSSQSQSWPSSVASNELPPCREPSTAMAELNDIAASMEAKVCRLERVVAEMKAARKFGQR